MENFTWPQAAVSIVTVLALAEAFGSVISDIIASFKKTYKCPCECHNMEEEE